MILSIRFSPESEETFEILKEQFDLPTSKDTLNRSMNSGSRTKDEHQHQILPAFINTIYPFSV
jgi:hypothetical protein